MKVVRRATLNGFVLNVKYWQQAFHTAHSCSFSASRRWKSDRSLQHLNKPPRMQATAPVKRQRVEATAQEDTLVLEETSQDKLPAAVPPASADPQPAQKRQGLATVLLVDKPQTWTSFDVCGKLKGVLRVKKIGHAGTLDPMATGLLIICTGRGTKSIDSFQAMHKEYSGTIKLGEATTSYDADGDVVETVPWEHLTLEQLREQVQKSFLGDLQQIPPMFSAIRVKGKRLYESAREGKEVERAARSVTVSQFDLTADAEDRQRVHFYISCSKGTYVRSLAHDLGKAVGSASHLVALRREAIGQYNVKDAWTVPQLTEQMQQRKQGQHPEAKQSAQQQT